MNKFVINPEITEFTSFGLDFESFSHNFYTEPSKNRPKLYISIINFTFLLFISYINLNINI